MNKSVIYIPLLDEGTEVYRPTEGEEVAPMTFKVLPTLNYDPENEHWAFPPGTQIRCTYVTKLGTRVLLAVEKV